MRISVIAFLFFSFLPAWPQQVGSITQKSSAPCTVNLVSISSNSTNIITCPDLTSAQMKPLNDGIRELIRDNRRLMQTLGEVEEWRRKYEEELTTFASAGIRSARSRKIDELLNSGQLDGARSILDQMVQDDAEESDRLAEDYYNRGRLDELVFDQTGAIHDYELAYQYRPDKYALAYGEILLKRGKFSQSEMLLRDASVHLRELVKLNSTLYIPALAAAPNDLGGVYETDNKTKDAAEAYEQALVVRRSLAQSSPGLYEADLAITFNNLAGIYDEMRRPKDAEKCYQQSLGILERLARSNPGAYNPWLAMTLGNLGGFYETQAESDDTEVSYKKAEECLKKALSLYRELARLNPVAYDVAVSMALSNLGNLYNSNDRMNDAEAAYGDALATARTATNLDPGNRWQVAAVLGNLCVFDNDKYEHEVPEHFFARSESHMPLLKRAEGACDESLAIYKELAIGEPSTYEPNVVGQLINLSNVYCNCGREKECIANREEALRISQDLLSGNPINDKYKGDVASELEILAVFYGNTGRKAEAESAYKQAVNLLRQLLDDDMSINRVELVNALEHLENFYSASNNLTGVIELVEERVEVYHELAKRDPEKFKVLEGIAQKELSNLRAQAKQSRTIQ